MQQYYVSRQNEQFGPFTIDQVVDKIKAKEFDLFDYVYDGTSSEWILLAEHVELKTKMSEFKPSTPPRPSPFPEPAHELSVPAETKVSPHDITEWYVLKGEHRFGPFSYADLIRMLQQKTVFGFDFAWNSGLSGWKRIAEMAEFQESMIRHLMANKPDKEWKNIFAERKHSRVRYAGDLIVHDNRSVWNGKGKELSIGGVGLTMENAMAVPGQRVILHFKPAEDVPAFNATGEVVSKKYVEGVREKTTPIEYGVRFISMSGEAKEKLMEVLKRKAA